jgi:hypothetical protein
LDVVKGAFDRIAKEESARLIRKTAPEIGTVSTRKGNLAALDIDVSPFDNSKTKKEGVLTATLRFLLTWGGRGTWSMLSFARENSIPRKTLWRF